MVWLLGRAAADGGDRSGCDSDANGSFANVEFGTGEAKGDGGGGGANGRVTRVDLGTGEASGDGDGGSSPAEGTMSSDDRQRTIPGGGSGRAWSHTDADDAQHTGP